MFSTLHGIYFALQMHFKMSPAICFNLDQPKILSSVNGLKEKKAITVHAVVVYICGF